MPLPGETTETSVMWHPGEEFGKNINGETVKAPPTPEVDEGDIPEPVTPEQEPEQEPEKPEEQPKDGTELPDHPSKVGQVTEFRM